METQMRDDLETMTIAAEGTDDSPAVTSLVDSFPFAFAFPASSSFLKFRTLPALLRRLESLQRMSEGEDANNREEGRVFPKLVVCDDRREGVRVKRPVLDDVLGADVLGGSEVWLPVEIVWRHGENRPLKVVAKVLYGGVVEWESDIGNLENLPGVLEGVLERLNHGKDRHGLTDGNGVVVRVEVTGPVGLHLITIEVPRLETGSEGFAERYFQDPDAVILVVVRAVEEISGHYGIAVASKYDPSGERTVVVVVDALNDRQNPTTTLVSNLGSRGSGIQSFVVKEQVGLDQLRGYLKDRFGTIIERNLDAIYDETTKTLSRIEQEIETIDASRPNLADIRQTMIDLSLSYRDLSQAALDGRYDNRTYFEFFGQNNQTRLRTYVEDLNTQFAHSMQKNDQVWKLEDTSASDSFGPEATGGTAQVIVSNAEVMQWVRKEYSQSRGRELPGGSNPALEAILFRQQSSRWPELAKAHVLSILGVVEQWMTLAVERITDEETWQREVVRILRQWLTEAKAHALEELAKLIDDETRTPLTYNPDFARIVELVESRNRRDLVQNAVVLAAQLGIHALTNHDELDELVSEIESNVTIDPADQACYEAYSHFVAYYKVTRDKFVENVARQVIDRHIVHKMPNAFTPRFSDEELLRFGSQLSGGEQRARRRTYLEKRAAVLRQGLAGLQ